jgi:glyoxylase-like metal-dependent hydrolase (beta-lactamase superfamily II)
MKLLMLSFAFALVVTTTTSVAAAPTTNDIRVYVLDCGKLDLDTLELFEDTDAYQATPGTMADPCFLIRHPSGDLLWDTGMSESLAGKTVEVAPGIRASVARTLTSQLAEIGVKPQEVDYVALSHLHFDHTGNLGLFKDSTWLISRKEVEWASSTPTPFGVDLNALKLPAREKKLLDLDFDVFGDGSVRILRASGHTPGHNVLMLNLKKSGVVVLSGDLYHTRKNFAEKRLPAINTSRAETLASFERVDRLLSQHHARFIIQHDAQDIATLPKFPSYLD